MRHGCAFSVNGSQSATSLLMTVEAPEFKRMIDYASRYNHTLKIPSASTVKSRIMEMGDTVVENIKDIIKV